jgi:hypothetical protein
MNTKPAPTNRDICGTRQGYRKHIRAGEQTCPDCRHAQRVHDNERLGTTPLLPAADLIEEIEHLLSLNQGHGYILQAIGYTGKETNLAKRLRANGRPDLIGRLTPEPIAA